MITLGASGGYVYTAAATISPSFPTGITAGQMLVLTVMQKPSVAAGGTVTTPAGWTLAGSVLDKGGYGATLGAEVGNTNLFMYTKVADGTEVGPLAITLGNSNSALAYINRWVSTGAFLTTAFVFGESALATSNSVMVQSTTGLSVATGDMVIMAAVSANSGIHAGGLYVAQPVSLSAPSISSPAVTLSSEMLNNTGNGVSGVWGYTSASSGSGTTPYTWAARFSSTETNARGPVGFLRLRDTAIGAPALIEGFKYLPSAAIGSRLVLRDASSGTTTWSRVANRSGGYAIRCSNSSGTAAANTAGSIVIPFGNGNFSIAYAANHRTATPASDPLMCGFTFYDAGTNTSYQVATCTNLSPAFGGVPSGASGWAIYNTTPTTVGWHWWNITGNMNVSAGGFVRVYRDGTLLAEVSGDTLATLVSPIRMILFVGNATGTSGLDIADLVCRSDAVIIPDSRVDVLSPVSTSAGGWLGSDADSVDNHLLIDDAGFAVDASDYVSANAAGLTDTYGIADLPHNPVTIYAVGVHAISRKDSGGSRAAAVLLNDIEGQTIDTGTSGIVYHYWETNPSGGTAWTKAAVDAMTAGIRTKT